MTLEEFEALSNAQTERMEVVRGILTPRDPADYLAFGSALVWTVWPNTSEVIAYTPDSETRTFRTGDLLELPEVLPGFSCRVEEIFAEVEE